jgi:hypothetical protein
MKRRIISPPSLPSIKRVTARFVSRSVCRSAYLRAAGRPSNATLSLQSINDLYPTFAVIWLSKSNSPSLESAGVLAVEKQSRDDRFALILSGQYEMFRAVDSMFNATRGIRSRTYARTTCYAQSRILSKTRAPTRRLRSLATADCFRPDGAPIGPRPS